MKVLIEIPQKAINIAKLQATMQSNDDDSLEMLDQAIEKCNKEVTEIDLVGYDDKMLVRACMAMVAIADRLSEIEKGK